MLAVTLITEFSLYNPSAVVEVMLLIVGLIVSTPTVIVGLFVMLGLGVPSRSATAPASILNETVPSTFGAGVKVAL